MAIQFLKMNLLVEKKAYLFMVQTFYLLIKKSMTKSLNCFQKTLSW